MLTIAAPRLFLPKIADARNPLGLEEAPLAKVNGKPIQAKILGFLRDNVHKNIPKAYYKAVLGHDLHIGVYAQLRIRKWDSKLETWVDPYTGLWCPTNAHAPIVSTNKVVVAFRDNLVDVLTATAGPLGTIDEFNFHELGTSAAAEVNTQTALTTPTGITLVAGTQVEGATADIYRTVATTTMDATETIQEHGVFDAVAAGTLMDRSTFAGIAVVNLDQIESTYEITFNEEP